MKKLLIFMMSSLLSGCIGALDFIPDWGDLAYSPQKEFTQISGANDVVIGVKVNDKREEKSNKVGNRKNGLGIEMAPIMVNEDLTVTFKRVIEQELQARGFKPGSESLVTIDVDLNKFWNDFQFGVVMNNATAELGMSIVVHSKSGKTLYSRAMIAHGIAPKNINTDGDEARLALSKALEDGMKQLFQDSAFFAALIEGSKKVAS